MTSAFRKLNDYFWLKLENIGLPIFLFWLFSLFFSYRYVFFTPSNYIFGTYSDFTAISLYISDILLFLMLTWLYFSREKNIYLTKPVFLWFIWIILSTLTLIPHLKTLNYWFLLKGFEVIVAYGTLFVIFTKYGKSRLLFIKIFALFTTIEGFFAILQFINQSSLNFLKYVGEPMINPSLPNVAKVVVDGIKYIRPYGTFPHPNLLSAFLFTGSLFLIYLLRNSKTFYSRIALSIAFFINLAGLFLTLSRASFLAFCLGFSVYGILAFTKQKLKERNEITSLVTVLTSGILLMFVLFPFLATRTTISDNASLERVAYTNMGIEMIQDNPIFGVGIGESVLHMQQYAPVQLEPWQIQPIHNYFLLIAAEVGLPGMIIIAFVMLWHAYNLLKNTAQDSTGISSLLFAIIVGFLVLMQFDHYFYTLQQTQLLLWSILALTAAQIKIEHDKNSSPA